MKITRYVAAALVSVLACLPAWADEFPSRPIRLVVPFPPGGSTDVGARIVAAKLSETLGQTVFVDNRPGAGTTIGAAYVAAAPADGYTLYVTGPVTHVTSQALYKNLRYDALKSFAPVGMMTTSPFIVVVHPSSPAKTLRQLLEAARARPGRLTYASSGNGAAPHLATEIIARATGTEFVHVPFRGVGPALVALMGEQVDFMIADVGVVPQLRDGRLRALALTTAKESALVPGVPSLAAAGVEGVDIPSALAVLAPAGTPSPVISRLNAALNGALADPEVKQKFALQGFETAPGTPQALADFLASEARRYTRIIREAGITID
ncbi:MAG: tripartite tricarboxylate transporter substrate binding protein [Pigmentiphaga sp.]|uniref:Bug family tripartite tricarboxylate transporter substrate binding protein n=1 Tax=Pigmentiphaga sp. TaxID=1977564 RepID=UPI0029B99B45|nr:tripartite tricarboxylate transporter substrate binding protein [Pigmentiphaga sp.]MDX3906180.1 tripartite tricarboxylate transporter substrate binding protein [Pigmentiphaga sp.]